MVRTLGALVVVAACGALAVHAQAPPATTARSANVLIGRVLDVGSGAPVGGAVVTITTILGASQARTDAPFSRNVLATAEGHFVFRDLPAGRYSIATRAFGYMNNDLPPLVVELHDGGKAAPVQLRLWKFAILSGRVTDERGEPIVGIPVAALRRKVVGGTLTLRQEGPEVLTDDRGVYRIAQLPPASYVVGVLSTITSLPAGLASALDSAAANRAVFPGLRQELINSASLVRSGEGHRVGDLVVQRSGSPLPLSKSGRPLGYSTALYPGTSNPTEATVIELGSGESREDIDLVIRFSETVSVSGVVNGPDGPMKNLAVRLAPPAADPDLFEPAGIATAFTDGGGAFTFVAVTTGEYTLKALYVSGDEATGEGVSLGAVQPLSVGDKDLAGVNVTMEPGVRVSGRVEFTGAPAPEGQRVGISLGPIAVQSYRNFRAIVRPDGKFTTMGDPPGRYTINSNAPTGWTWVSTTLAGKPIVDELIELKASDLTDLVLTFAKSPTRVSGSVTEDAGVEDAGIDVIVFPADSAAWRENIFTSRRVRRLRATFARAFDIPALPPGEYYVAAVSSRLTSEWQDAVFLSRLVAGATRFKLSAGEEKSLRLSTITPGGR